MNTPRKFQFSAAWSNDHDDVADVSLVVGANVISRIADIYKGTVRDYFRASATSMALWLADNWWRLRWETIRAPGCPPVEWRLRHELNSASGGALWPPVMIYSGGDRIAFAPAVRINDVTGPQSYFPFKVSMVAASDYEAELDRLFSDIINHCARTEDGKALKALLGQIATERQDVELAAWRRLEACLGFDPDAAPDAVIDALVQLEDVAGEEGVEEAAHAQPGGNSGRVLKEVIEATRESSVTVNLGLVHKVTGPADFPRCTSPWQMAEMASKDLRSIIGVTRGPLSDADFAGIFSQRWEDLKAATATARTLVYGARISEGDQSRLALQTVRAHDRRFELARQFADGVWQKGAGFGIISRSKTDRQKFQRAFANSLLCPFDDLQCALDVNDPTPEAIDDAALKFRVHRSVVRNQLVYKGYLPFENKIEEAEAA